MLGKTVPEPTSERVTQYVCSAGVELNDEYDVKRLVRLYPLGIQGCPTKWSVSNVNVNKHPRDNRMESYLPTSAFGQIGDVRSKDCKNLEQFIVAGIKEANSKRLSLAIMCPAKGGRFILDNNADDEPSYQLFKDGEALKAKERFPHTPRYEFETEDGSHVRPQVREWGLWELMRKNHERLSEMTKVDRVAWVGNSLHITPTSWFFMGNFANHRNAWLIISVLNVLERT